MHLGRIEILTRRLVSWRGLVGVGDAAAFRVHWMDGSVVVDGCVAFGVHVLDCHYKSTKSPGTMSITGWLVILTVL